MFEIVNEPYLKGDDDKVFRIGEHVHVIPRNDEHFKGVWVIKSIEYGCVKLKQGNAVRTLPVSHIDMLIKID